MYSSVTFLRVEALQHRRPIQPFGQIGTKAAAEQRGRVGNHDRSGLDGADHGAKYTAGRIVENAADRVGELAGLLAELVEAPSRAGRELRHADGLDQIVRLQHRGERGHHQVGHGDRPDAARATRRRPWRRSAPARRASRRPGPHGQCCRRWCRDCAPRGTRCGRRPGEAGPRNGRQRGRPRYRHG